MPTPAYCCPGRPAHSRSRAFFRAAATLALVAGSLSGSLSPQAMATDFNNPLGSTAGTQFYAHGNAPVNFTNAGTVNGVGIYDNPSNAITNFNNSGLISALVSLSLFDHSTITNLNNTGTISGDYTAMQLNDHATIGSLNNTGIIRGVSGGSVTWTRGIDIQQTCSIGTLTNSGTLEGYQYGIMNLTGGSITTLSNSGTISGFDAGVDNGGSIGTFSNSGTIAGTNGTAIGNYGTIGTLNLLSGSVLNGSITNSGAIGTLNVYKTVTNANFDTASLVPTIIGNQPGTTNLYLTTPANCKYVTVGGRAIGIDTSGFGANTDAIRHVSNSVARLANTNGVIQSIGAKAAKHAAAPYTMTSDLCADGAPAPADQVGNSDFWIRGFMGRNQVDASASSVDYVNTYSGGAVGIERDWADDVRAGAFIGAGNMKNSLGSGLGGSDADLIFLGTHATKTWGTVFAKVGLTGGSGKNTGTRNIAAATPEVATAKYGSWYLSPEATVGRVYDLGQHLGGSFSVTPQLSARYVYAKQDAYTETGATNNLTMNSSSSTTLEERAELKFSYATRAFNDSGVKINASIGGIAQQNNGVVMSGTLLGAPLSFASPGSDKNTGFVGGIGFEINRGKYTFTASGDYVRLSGGNADLSANVVLSVKF
jgi:outer membrane autotransporter protein